MINKSIIAAAVVASLSFAPFVLAQVQSGTPDRAEPELDLKAGTQSDPRTLDGPQDPPRMMDGRGEGYPGMMRGPPRGPLFE